jgi:hypothetical protein
VRSRGSFAVHCGLAQGGRMSKGTSMKKEKKKPKKKK